MNWIKENFLASLAVILVVAFGTYFFVGSGSEQAYKGSFKDVNQSSMMKRGSESAPVSMIQYSDFLCPSCSLVSTQVMPKIEEEYIVPNTVQFEFRPMAFIAEGSFTAGMGAYCAVDQNKFWEYHDSIYAFVAHRVFNEGLDPQRDTILDSQIVKEIAKQSGLESVQFDECLDSSEHYSDINQSTINANANGINGTPYILVNGESIKGNPTYDTINALIKASL